MDVVADLLKSGSRDDNQFPTRVSGGDVNFTADEDQWPLGMLPPLGGLALAPAAPPWAAPLVVLLPPAVPLLLLMESELEFDEPLFDVPLEVEPEPLFFLPRFCLPVLVELPFDVPDELLYCWLPVPEPEFMLPVLPVLPELPAAPLVLVPLPLPPEGVVWAMATVPANNVANNTAAVCVFISSPVSVICRGSAATNNFCMVGHGDT